YSPLPRRPEIFSLSLHDALPISVYEERLALTRRFSAYLSKSFVFDDFGTGEADDDGLEFRNAGGGQANNIVWVADGDGYLLLATDRKSTRLNSSHVKISYAVFCL